MPTLSEKFESLREDIEKNLSDAQHYLSIVGDSVREALSTIERELKGISSDIEALEDDERQK